ncbi:MAG TPA: SCO family protein [Longimicrobiales bacterium]
MEDRIVREGLDREEGWTLAALLFLLVVTAAWWALALVPADADSPAWLARTQAVCFGTRDNGMPNAAGWIGLIASPLGMLIALLVVARQPVARLAAHLRSVRWLQIVSAVAFILTLAGGVSAASRIRQAYGVEGDVIIATEDGTAIRRSGFPPPLLLTDQTGGLRALRDMKGTPVVVTFAYAHCETVCPVLVQNALAAQRALAADGVDVAVVVVTLDPARDTPARLPAIAVQWGIGANAYVLSGVPADVDRALDAWEITRATDPANGDITHASIAHIISRTGEWAYEVSSPTPALLARLLRDS